MSFEMFDRIKREVGTLMPALLDIRHHLHQHPELSFEEHQTSAYLKAMLHQSGIEIIAEYVNTGFVAKIKGSSEGPVRAIRAELDALPIKEKNDVPYTSKKDGVMHACGHDVHMTCAMGAALVLNNLKDELKGTVYFIFQPGEEKLPGGAYLMIKEGLLDHINPAYIIAQHVYPNLPAGKIGWCPGQYMASSDEIYITIQGKGGHGALPHLTKDPVMTAAHVLTALQTVVARSANPLIPSVLTFGKINTEGGATNVIPEKVYLEGTFRTMDEEWRKAAKILIKSIAEETAKGFGLEAEVNIIEGYPMLNNDEEISKMLREKAEAYLGVENVVSIPKRMTSEDFAYFAQKKPCCFFRLGTNNEQNQFPHSVHSPHFNIDESAIETGTGLMTAMIL